VKIENPSYLKECCYSTHWGTAISSWRVKRRKGVFGRRSRFQMRQTILWGQRSLKKSMWC